MSAHPPPGPDPNGSDAGRQDASGVGRRIEEAVELIEMELRHTIAYINDAVVPQVQRESVSALRAAADTLRNLADRFEQSAQPPKGPRA